MNFKCRLLSLFLIANVLMGCHSIDVKDLNISSVESSDNLEVIVKGNLIDGAQLTTILATVDDVEYLYRARPFSNSIQRVDLLTGEVKTTKFLKEGPNKVRRIQSFLLNSDGNLVVAADENILVVDTKDSIQDIFKFYPNNVDVKLDGPFIVRATHEFPLQGYKNDLIVVLERDDSDKFSFPHHYEGPFLGRFNIEEKKITPLPIEWPEPTKYFGGLHQPFFTVVGDQILFGFAYSPHIYSFDFNDNRVTKTAQPVFGDIENIPFVGSFDQEEILAHRAKSVAYGKLNFDPVTGKYSQLLFAPPLPSSPMYGIAQRVGVRYFSKDLLLLGEKILPLGFFPEQYFYKGSLFIRFQNDVIENKLLFRKVSP